MKIMMQSSLADSHELIRGDAYATDAASGLSSVENGFRRPGYFCKKLSWESKTYKLIQVIPGLKNDAICCLNRYKQVYVNSVDSGITPLSLTNLGLQALSASLIRHCHWTQLRWVTLSLLAWVLRSCIRDWPMELSCLHLHLQVMGITTAISKATR